MASIQDVARLAGVSPITVSRVVRNQNHVSQATREQVLDAIATLNYIPNAVARGLRQARSGMIAFLVTDISSPFYTAVAHGATDAARANGLSLLFGNTAEDAAVETEYLRAIGERRVDGVVFAPTSVAAVAALPRTLPVETPVVFFDRAFPGVEADVVRCDTRRGVYALCRHLIGLGHRRIAIVGGVPKVPTWHERVAGYRDALSEAGLAVCPELEIAGDYERGGGTTAVRHLLTAGELPDVIVAANSQVALGVLDALAVAGRRVPEDVGVASVDDPLPKSGFWPRFTVVEQPGYDMGKAAVELLVARLRDPRGTSEPREVVFDADLLVGTSCGEASLLPTNGQPVKPRGRTAR